LSSKLFLRDWRKDRGLTQPALADEAGLHRVTISRLETGREAPTMETVAKLAGALGIEVGELFRPPKRHAPVSWRDRLRALSEPKKRDLALAASASEQWPGNVSTRSLRALKVFCQEHGITPDDVLAELIAETPGLGETLDTLNARAKERAEAFAREAERLAEEAAAELDDTLRRGRDAS